MEGWIKIHRKMLDNPIICKDSDYLSVWIYLLVNATHKEIPALFKGQKITLKQGQLITGRKSISSKLKISESKIYRIINDFKSEHQIEQQTSNKNSLITIINWNRYQNNEQQNETQMNNKRTTSEQQVNTNKNVKNVNNIYLFLLNKYKQNLPKTFAEKIHRISEIKNSEEYQSLSFEDQNKLFNELTFYKGG